VCLQAGSAEGCHRERPGPGEAGPAGAHGAEAGAGEGAGAAGDPGETAQRGAEEPRYLRSAERSPYQPDTETREFMSELAHPSLW